MTAILTFFIVHWMASVFAQTFYLHRYAAHSMFTMNKFWEKFFHIFTYVAQGSSFLDPWGYAVLHRMHHMYSDTPDDPHSPMQSSNVFTMMWKTKKIYSGFAHRKVQPDERVLRDYIPTWPLIDKLAQSWFVRIGFGTAYTLFYIKFVPEGQWGWYLLLPFHYLMGPIHGAIVNWGGHKYGYTNHDDTGDNSKNTLPVDFLTLGELFQNNHHHRGNDINFGYARWYEVDVAWQVIKVLKLLHIVKVRNREDVPELTEEAA
jgi:stearoyl-CoA desaturase (delta-9 desaturase)